jgi:hypothetical protein
MGRVYVIGAWPFRLLSANGLKMLNDDVAIQWVLSHEECLAAGLLGGGAWLGPAAEDVAAAGGKLGPRRRLRFSQAARVDPARRPERAGPS